MCCSKFGRGRGGAGFLFGGLSFVHVCPRCHSVCVPLCKCGRGDKVKDTPLTLALLAASTLYVGSRRARRALRGGAGDGLTLHRAVLVRGGGGERERDGEAQHIVRRMTSTATSATNLFLFFFSPRQETTRLHHSSSLW